MVRREVVLVHKSTIKHGDTIMREGFEVTVSRNNIKTGFMGITIFGNSYRLGQQLVEKVIFTQVLKNSFTTESEQSTIG